MKKTLLPLLLCLGVSFAVVPVIKAGSRSATTISAGIANATAPGDSLATVTEAAPTAEAAAAELYHSLELDRLGLSFDAMKYAWKGFQELQEQGAVPNDAILTVIDFSQPSSKKRMYILDVRNKQVLYNTYVAHGKNSGLQYAERFSNRHESLQSSLGFYVTKGTYFGKHGLSLRLAGQEEGFNSNAESRAVVVHGAEYIGSSRADAAFMGRSFGCPAVPQAQSATVINMIKNGTALFIYHPSQTYIHGSKLLNS
ncbi:murein L,D-transpeptidase catalytic domain family protein [Flaviaesturariibacter amylovorans]|uniref:Murein L,D-transpeptidase catalytic domain family protein n=1 Tax=Flaviaesturariibacter amylovorans TaxID=1084520 RepID=A0ABP8HG82_9BACT